MTARMREVKAYRPVCDVCHFEGEVVFADRPPALPEGWGTLTMHNCGMTGYTRTDALCPKHAELAEDKR